MAGEQDKIEGKLKEGAGGFTGDRSTEMEGEAQGKFGESQDRLEAGKEEIGERIEEGSEDFRERI